MENGNGCWLRMLSTELFRSLRNRAVLLMELLLLGLMPPGDGEYEFSELKDEMDWLVVEVLKMGVPCVPLMALERNDDRNAPRPSGDELDLRKKRFKLAMELCRDPTTTEGTASIEGRSVNDGDIPNREFSLGALP